MKWCSRGSSLKKKNIKYTYIKIPVLKKNVEKDWSDIWQNISNTNYCIRKNFKK